MNNYEKPIVLANNELSEGVFAASGGSECYTVSSYIHQTPQVGRGDYRIQLNATHAADDKHHSGQQILTISFNQPVEYSSSNGTALVRAGTELKIQFNYHSNASDNIGLGELVVISDPGLAITDCVLECNYNCGQHTW